MSWRCLTKTQIYMCCLVAESLLGSQKDSLVLPTTTYSVYQNLRSFPSKLLRHRFFASLALSRTRSEGPFSGKESATCFILSSGPFSSFLGVNRISFTSIDLEAFYGTYHLPYLGYLSDRLEEMSPNDLQLSPPN